MFGLNNSLAFQVHGGGHEGGLTERLSNFLAVLEGVAAGRTNMLDALLPGVAGMVNIHPLAVHFPIALLTMFFLVELAASVFKQPKWYRVASGLLYLGTACAAVAVYLGVQAAETVAHDEVVHEIMEHHEMFGFTILSVAVFLCVWRAIFNVHKHVFVQITHLLCAALLTILIVLGADLGGVMVYQHAVAVKIPPIIQPVMPNNAPHDHHGHDHSSHSH